MLKIFIKYKKYLIFILASLILIICLVFFIKIINKKTRADQITKTQNSPILNSNDPASSPTITMTPTPTPTTATTEEQESTSSNPSDTSDTLSPVSGDYPIHSNVATTVFWVGEGASNDNNNISNVGSAWDSFWQEHFGGIDDPKNRNGYFPAEFTPNENPFYFALPYSDLNDNGERKANAQDIVYWAHLNSYKENESMCKNRWIKIEHNGQYTYAQWEDSGPGFYDDSGYVFGRSQPQNSQTGLDVSPAVKDYLALDDIDSVSWQFIDQSSVSSGPWKEIVTTSQVSF